MIPRRRQTRKPQDVALLRTGAAVHACLEIEDRAIGFAQLRFIGQWLIGHGFKSRHAPYPGGMNETALPPLTDIMAADWAEALASVEPNIRQMGAFLRAELTAGRRYLPSGERIFRAFETPLADVRVLIVGQDPYPTPGHPIGLSFAVERDVRPLPRSLHNIYLERESDLGIPPSPHGDLSAWQNQGVMLLNRALTVAPGAPASHRGKGWEQITMRAIEALVERGGPLVAILWGRDARSLAPMLAEGGVSTIESAHPSPLSARRGFFGSKPFSRANALLAESGAQAVDWNTP